MQHAVKCRQLLNKLQCNAFDGLHIDDRMISKIQQFMHSETAGGAPGVYAPSELYTIDGCSGTAGTQYQGE